MMNSRVHVLVPLLALASCGQAENEPGPGGVTVGEARALDAAAQMLDARRPPEEAIQPSVMATPTEADPMQAGER